MANQRTYRYAVVEEGKYVDVEMAGRFVLNENDDPKEKAKAVIISTQRVPENSIKLEKVDDLQSGIITSEQTPNKNK